MVCVRKSIVLLGAVACLGCGPSIKVTRVMGDVPIVTGNPWNLPMTQFNITITRHVTKCGKDIEGKVEVLATTASVLDEQQRYVLESDGIWSTSDITSNLAANGVSTGLNAQSASAAGAIVSNVVTTFSKLAVLGGAVAALDVQELCSEDVRAAIKELFPVGGTSLKDQVDADTAALAEETAKVELLSAEAAADKQNKQLKAKLIAAMDEQAKAKRKLADSQGKLTKNLKVTSDTQVVSWPLKGDEFRKDCPFESSPKVFVRRDCPFELSPDAFAKWTGRPRKSEEERRILEELYAHQRKQFAVYIALLRPKADGSWTAPATPPSVDVRKGVPVRLAQTGRLLICQESPCPTEIAAAGIKDPKITQSDQVVLQMGQMYIVPLTGGTFHSQSGAITLDANGRPTTIQVVQKTAAAEAATAAAKDTATQLAALPADIRAAEIARIRAQTDEATAKSALATAQANLAVADQTSSLAAQNALIKAQTDLATAKLNAGVPLQTAALTAQTNLINAQAALATAQTSAQTALINAQVNLATAQANAAIIDKTSVLAAQTALLNAETALVNAGVALAKAQATQAALP